MSDASVPERPAPSPDAGDPNRDRADQMAEPPAQVDDDAVRAHTPPDDEEPDAVP